MRSLFIVLLLIFPFFGNAQSIDIVFGGSISNKDKGNKEAGVTVKIIQNGATVATATTASNGRYTLKGKIDVKKPFDVSFGKTGFAPKMINFNLSSINLEDTPAGDFKPVEALDLDLFAERPGIDFSFLATQHVGKFTWDVNGFVKVDEPHRKMMADKIDKLLKDSENNAKKNELAYNEAIKAADKAFNEKKYEAAMAKYEEALSVPGKAKEKYPNDQIILIDGLLQKQKEENLKFNQDNAAYVALIKAADALRDAGNYEKAIDKYNEALDLKDDEQYPFDQIKLAKAKIKEKENEAKYKKLIEAADIMVKQKSYRAARDNYAEASKLKPNEQFPKDKIKELEDKIKLEEDAAASKLKYEALVAEGERLVKEEKWEEAKAKYLEAQAIEKASTYVAGQLVIIEKKLAEIKANKDKLAKIEQLMKEGDQAKTDKKFTEALAKFKEVVALDPANSIAPPKITEIEQIIADEAKNKQLNDQFNALVKQGDDAVVAKKLKDALVKYNEALALKDDAAVKIKKEEVEQSLAATEKAEQLEANFKKLIDEGTAALTAKSYPEALAKFQGALDLKPTDEPTLKKVSEVKKIIADQQSAADLAKKIEQLLQEGISLMEGGAIDGPQLEPAKVKFNEVLAIDQKNATAIGRIAQIDKLLLAQKDAADKEAKFAENVAKGDAEIKNDALKKAIDFYQVALTFKEDASVRAKIDEAQTKLKGLEELKKLEEAYQKSIAEANGLRDAKKYEEAITKYEAAKQVKPNDAYAQDEINKIQQILAALKSEKDKSEQITKLLADGEALASKKEFAAAKEKFNGVKNIDEKNATAIKRIADMDAELAKLEGEQAKQQKIAALLQEGQTLFTSDKLTEAEAKFKEVIALDNSNVTAVKYLADIQTKLAEQKKNAENQKQFSELVAKGDAAVSSTSWEQAIKHYSDALQIQQDASVQAKLASAQQKLTEQLGAKEIDAKYAAAIKIAEELEGKQKLEEALAKYQDAKAIKSSEVYPQQKIDALTQALASKKQFEEKRAQVDKWLAEGKAAFDAKNYAVAKSAYQQVIGIDSGNDIASKRLQEIEEIEKGLSSQQEQEALFAQLKQSGKDAFATDNFDKALADFDKALKIKNDTEITNLIAQIATIKQEKIAKKAELDKLLAEGQTAFDKKNWSEASDKYKKVINLDPSNTTAKSQLAIIEGELIKLQGESKNEAEFARLKAQGLSEFGAKEWEKAKHSMNEALKIKSDNELSKKIEEIEKIQAEIAKNSKLKQEYDDALSKAQNAEAAKDYLSAKTHYTTANNLIASDQLKAKIDELNKLLDQQKELSATDKKYNELLAKGDELLVNKNYAGAIQKYNEALQQKQNEQLPVIKAKEAERLAADQKKHEEDAAFDKIINAINTKIDEGDYKKAKDYIKTATSLRPTDPRPTALLAKIDQLEKEQRDFDALIELAEKDKKSKKYTDALVGYEKARVIKPSNQELLSKIEELRVLINESTNLKDKEAIFKQYFDAGVAKQSSNDFDNALVNYKNALKVKPLDPATVQKIAEVEAAIAQRENEKQLKASADEAFNKLVLAGDGAFNSRNYTEAISSYREALKLRTKNEYVNARIAESERLIQLEKTNQNDAEYQAILTKADGYLNLKEYDQALQQYKLAVSKRPSDVYPATKIKEINGILNPLTEKSDELENLGEPFDGSILDGELALKDAAAQREEKKRSSIKKANEGTLNAAEEKNKASQITLEKTVNDVYKLYTQLLAAGKVQDANNIEIANSVKAKQLIAEDVNNSNQNYSRQEIFQTQDKLTGVTDKVTSNYEVDSKLQEANHLQLDSARMLAENKVVDRTELLYDDNQASNNEIVKVNQKVSENTKASTVDATKIAKEVDAKRTTAENISTQKGNSNYDKSIESRSSIVNTEKLVSEREVVSTEKLNETRKEVIQKRVANEDKGMIDNQTQHHNALGTKDSISYFQGQKQLEDRKKEAKLIETIDEIKVKEQSLVDKDQERYASVANKNNETKAIIEEQDVKRNDENRLAEVAKRDVQLDVAKREAATNQAQVNKQQSDQSERLLTQNEMDLKQVENTQRTTTKENDIKEKGDAVKDKVTGLEKANSTQSSEKTDQIQKTRDALNKINANTPAKTIVPNTLGEKYPEGVSQEMFQRKDDAGILTAIVTRRIVVIEGRGTEYIRTQTNHAITYSKNGSPITEYVWQKETQDAKLQRHY